MATKPLVVFSIIALVCFSTVSIALSQNAGDLDDDEEFLRFLEEEDAAISPNSDPHHDAGDSINSDEISEDNESSYGGDSHLPPVPVDEKDVVVLKESNFSDFVSRNRHVMVEFYAPWCGHCQALAPEYAAAATELKGAVVLAKIDGAEEKKLSEKYGVEGFPTVYFFVDGVHLPYPGQRTKEAIVNWVKKRTGPAVYNITTTEEAEHILAAESKIVLGFLNTLEGQESEELRDASKLEDDVNFYQTTNLDVAKLFGINPQVKPPTLVVLKKELENINHFEGHFTKSAIADFVFVNKLPLVTTLTKENVNLVFEYPIKKQMLLFATSDDSEKLMPAFQEAAKSFKGKIIFIYVDIENEDVGKPVSNHFGVHGNSPRILAYTGNEDGMKFVLHDEFTSNSIKTFGENLLDEKLKPFYPSDPIPETNDGDVKIVVGKNFEEIVLDESKDVLLEVYAPWCGFCQELEPMYNKLGKHLRGVDSLVIAKMDGTRNEHPRAKVDGFPAIFFFPAGNKSSDPIFVETDRTLVDFYKFLKQHASIPLKLNKPDSSHKYSKDEL